MSDDSTPSTLQERLEKFFTPQLSAALSKPGALDMPLRHLRPEFILAVVRDDDPVAALEQLRALIDLVDGEGVSIEVFGPMAIVTCGGIFDADAPRPVLEARHQSLVAKIAAALGQNVALVHGSGNAVVGNVGGDKLFRYGCLFASFSAILKALTEIRFGEIKEWQG